MTVDINCDLGEQAGDHKSSADDAIMPFITSANIACGFHAGDPATIMKTIKSAIKNNVGIGAHPGYADREGFGRRSMKYSHEELRASVLYQVGALKIMSEAAGGKLRHVKPHGALYNAAATDFELAMVIAHAVKEVDSSLIMIGLSGSEMMRASAETGLTFASEVFADRAYNDDGTLVSRDLPGAVLLDTAMVVERALIMAKENKVETVSGITIPVQADTICLHGDNQMVVEFAKGLISAFKKHGIGVRPIG